jgi:hypothetical protein
LTDPIVLRNVHKIEDMGDFTLVIADVTECYTRDQVQVRDIRRTVYTLEGFMLAPFEHTETYCKEAQKVARKIEQFREDAHTFRELQKKSALFRWASTCFSCIYL